MVPVQVISLSQATISNLNLIKPVYKLTLKLMQEVLTDLSEAWKPAVNIYNLLITIDNHEATQTFQKMILILYGSRIYTITESALAAAACRARPRVTSGSLCGSSMEQRYRSRSRPSGDQ